MQRQRQSGILLHPTSLPGPYGVGELGDSAYRFVDFLGAAEQSLWQVLPLGPTGYGHSPYQSFSAFAGNPLLVSLELLQADGLLDATDLAAAPRFDEHAVDFEAAQAFRWEMLERAHAAFLQSRPAAVRAELERFCSEQASWLDDYTLYMVLKEAAAGAPWYEWEPPLRDRTPGALERARADLSDRVDLHRFVQFLFFHQWLALKRYANARGVRILGDIPIFVAHDSADVWANPELFWLDDDGRCAVVAGVPPDYFSNTGQRWGNPLYRWDEMARQGYAWWIDRFRLALTQADLVRIDHFRGFEAYWEIPAAAETAVDGRWVKGPGEPFFVALREALGSLPIIAEDLGLITPAVRALRLAIDAPGMAVLHFAFGGAAENEYLPHNLQPGCVIYTGTHDNDTTCGWYDSVDDEVRHHLRCYLGCDGNDIAWDLIRAALRSVAETTMIPVQDLLSLGSGARMNQPAQTGGNWAWRFREGALGDDLTGRLRELTRLFGRAPVSADRGAKA